MRYALGHSFNLQHVFEKFQFKKLTTKYTVFQKIIHSAAKIDLCIEIFTTHLKMVLEDVINNDVTFQLPTGARPADIHMIVTSEEDFTKARKNGKFKEVDFLNSNFTGNQLGLYMYGNGRTRIKKIYVDKQLKQQITDKTNAGHQYA